MIYKILYADIDTVMKLRLCKKTDSLFILAYCTFLFFNSLINNLLSQLFEYALEEPSYSNHCLLKDI